jgi:hypothetical protein
MPRISCAIALLLHWDAGPVGDGLDPPRSKDTRHTQPGASRQHQRNGDHQH